MLLFLEILIIKIYFNLEFYLGVWGLGIGDWGLGIGDWGLGPIPNPQLLISEMFKYNIL